MISNNILLIDVQQVLTPPDLDTENMDVTSGSTEKMNTVRSRARMFEKTASSSGGDTTQRGDAEGTGQADQEHSKPNIKYLIAKFQATKDDVADFTPNEVRTYHWP